MNERQPEGDDFEGTVAHCLVLIVERIFDTVYVISVSSVYRQKSQQFYRSPIKLFEPRIALMAYVTDA